MAERGDMVRELLEAFAERTGLVGERAPVRYLWTDAFAVCTFLGRHRATGEARWLDRARELVEQVHGVLGRHRPDDPRTGWISGLSESDGARHPTVGGLRIGKPLPERKAHQRFDRELEWERDGQYYHYLTRWIHALTRLALETGDGAAARHAAELSSAAHRGFAYRTPDGERRLHWKMSIDLQRALVPSMGQHDPLDGLVTLSWTQAALGRVPEGLEEAAAPRLDREVRELADMCRARSWATDDPLGVGGLLVDTFLLARLLADGEPVGQDDPAAARRLLEALLLEAGRSVGAIRDSPLLERPADQRLAFRELGLSLGLAAAAELPEMVRRSGLEEDRIGAALALLRQSAGMRQAIHAFWLQPAHRDSPLWLEHRDISDVMLAASLDPRGYLGIESPTARHGAAGD